MQLIPLEQAQEIILGKIKMVPKIEVELLLALNMVLAEDIYAGNNLPPFDRSPLDGYAVRSEDIKGVSEQNPVFLELIEKVPAGYMATKEVVAGTAIAVMTGSPIPEGADVVIMIEETKLEEGQVAIYKGYKANSNISRAGEDVKKGELVLTAGSLINSGAIGMLAALGKKNVNVYRKPRVAILSTGDELIDIDQPLKPGKIRNSNLYALAAAIQEAGGESFLLGSVPDQIQATKEKVTQGLKMADLVLTTGGVSVGDYDVVKDVFLGLGAELLFWRVDIKPGTPAVAALLGDKIIIGLSGNPAAAFITFEHLVRPVLRKLSGHGDLFRRRVKAILDDEFLKSGRQRRFLRSMVNQEEGTYHVTLTGKQNPGIMKSILHCNALVDVPSNGGPLKAGDQVDVILLDG